MSATNSTTHYNLPSFLGSDKPAWLVDWNGAMATIDSAIYEAKQAADTAGTSASAVASDLATLSGTVSTQGSTISTLSETLTTAVGNINTINGNINTINSLIGNGTPTTTDQTIIGAINEINANVGDPADASGVTGSDAFEKIATLNASLTNKVSVTSDGVKTRVQMLNSLYALIDKTKITTRSCLMITYPDKTEFWHIQEFYSDSIRCSKTKTYTDETYAYTFLIKASDSEYNQAIIKTNSVVINSNPGSAVDASGIVYDFYY